MTLQPAIKCLNFTWTEHLSWFRWIFGGHSLYTIRPPNWWFPCHSVCWSNSVCTPTESVARLLWAGLSHILAFCQRKEMPGWCLLMQLLSPPCSVGVLTFGLLGLTHPTYKIYNICNNYTALSIIIFKFQLNNTHA